MSKKLILPTLGVAAVLGVAGVISQDLTVRGLAHEATVATTNATSTLATSESSLLDSTIYVLLNPDGSVRKTITSDWAKVYGADQYSKLEDAKTAPLALTVTYTLDGQPISASDLAGKSGHVTVRYDYTNQDQHGDIYMPYLALTGLVLDNDHFSNVSVVNGKLSNDGARTIVAGLTLPGLQHSLSVSTSTLSLPEYFEFSADVTDFKLGITMTLATSEIFSHFDTANLNTLDQLATQLNQLVDAMNQLLAGSAQLYDGLAQLNTSVNTTLVPGVNSLVQNLEQLSYNLNNNIDANSDYLVSSAKQIFDGLLAIANPQLSGLGLPTLTTDNYGDYYDTLQPYESVNSTVQLLNGYYAFYTGLQSYTAGVHQASLGAAQIVAGASQLQAGLPTLTDGIAQLQTGASALNTGLITFNQQGVQRLVDAYNGDIRTLSDRIKQLVNLARSTQTPVKYVFRTDEIKTK